MSKKFIFYPFPEKITQNNKQLYENVKFGKKKYFSSFQKFKKREFSAERLAFVNEIKPYIYYICEIEEEDTFSGGPPKNVYFLCKLFYLRFTKKV